MLDKKLLRKPAVMERTGLKTTTLYERVGKGLFPAPVKIGRCSLWLESEVDAWIAAHVTRRDTLDALTQSGTPEALAIRELLSAIDDASERGISSEAIDGALGPVNVDHDNGVLYTRSQAARVRALHV